MAFVNGALILAGGRSERMLYPKSYLLFKGKTFLKTIIDEYVDAGIRNICVVINEKFNCGEWEKYLDEIRADVTIINNPNPEFGRSHSLKLGIKKMLGLDFCFIQNVDNPFVNKELINRLMETKNSFGYTSPTHMGRSGHPVLISKIIMRYIDQLPEGDFNLKSVLSGFNKKKFEVNNDNILVNINTADDYQKHTGNTLIGERHLQ